jgi:hypothetical protein
MNQKLIAVLTLFLLLGFAGNAARGDLATGLVAHWQFEGSFNDSAGTNHGAANGDAKIVVDAERGQVLELDGTGDYVEVPNSPSLNLTGDKVSMAVWVNFTDVAPIQIVIAKVFNNTTHASPYFSYGLHKLANAQPRVWISRTGGAAYQPGATNSMKAQTWHHLAGVYNGAQLRLYLDGKLAASSNVTGNLIGYDTVLRLGINGGLTEPMAGKMDDVRIYNRELTEREIVSLATGVSLGTAWNPDPANGATGVGTPLLQWGAGENAFFHDVYLGTSADLGAANLVASRQPLTMYFHAPGLEPGVTYYWRVDEIEADLKTVHTGDVWSFSALPATAHAAQPPDRAEFVSAEQPQLAWIAGINAITHDVYFGEDAAAVGAGAASTFKGNQSANTYSPGALQKAKTYYWRVDEVGPAGKVTGAVWSFATVPDIAVVDPSLVAWWKFEEGEASTAVDWSGNGNHAAAKGDAKIVLDAERGPVLQLDGTGDYLEAANSPSLNITGDKVSLTAWVNFDSVATVQMIVCKVFNNTTHASPYFSYGLHTLANGQPRFWISRTGGAANRAGTTGMFKVGTWHHVAGVYDGAQMQLYLDGVLAATTNVTGTLIGYDTVLRMGTNGGLTEPLKGKLDDIRVYNRALTADELKEVMRGDPTLAWDPIPANGATTDAVKAATLTWQAGDKATGHDVYLGTDRVAVRGADSTDTTGIYRGRLNKTGYDPTPAVEWGREYFWRVDEVSSDGTITKGYLWSFKVADYLIVDDFESYNDDVDAGTTIYDTWIDGLTNGLSGSQVGYTTAPFAERTIIQGGRQSMPLMYDNTKSPYYSEASRTFAVPEDWTVGGVQTLQLQVRGQALPGSVGYDAATQVYTMTGAGANIWDRADQFHFAYKELNGDGSITARLDSISANPPHGDPRIGVMIRESLDPNAANALLFVEPDPRTRLTQRVRVAETTTDVAVAPVGKTPTWLRLTRTGFTFKAEKSDNGTAWTPILDTGSEASIFMTDPVYIGLVVCSHAAGKFVEGKFSNVRTTGQVTPAGPFTASQDIGIASNSPQPLYVTLQDKANHAATVTNATLSNATAWTAWNIPLADFAGVNAAAVKTMILGVGDRENPAPDGAGLVYLDNIRVTK